MKVLLKTVEVKIPLLTKEGRVSVWKKARNIVGKKRNMTILELRKMRSEWH